MRGRSRDACIEARDQPVGAGADLADVKIVELRIKLRRTGDRGAAEHGDLTGRLGARGDVVDLRRAWTCMPLTMTTSVQAKSAALAWEIFSSMKRTANDFGR